MRVAAAGSLLCVALCAVAGAQPIVHPGPQGVPPVTAGEPVLPQQLDGRRAVRGCAVDEHCARPADVIRELDVELFPKPGTSPWLDERTPPPSRVEGTQARVIKRPSELRPDAPWLDQLELPDIPVRWTQKLVDYLVFYKTDPRGRSIIESWLVAQGRYRELIASHLRKAHLPQDLIYVAMIESSYDPNDSSSAGALGLWQFMPEGGRIYGLRQDRWVDERRDPYRSTIAQMDYFADLYQRFGDWHIALAAFNAGYGAILRSIARYNTNDYYKLCEYENGIPWETCLYTPKVLATAIVGHNRAVFGMDKVVPAPAETWDEVAVPVSLPLSLIARAAGVTDDDVKRLNPQLRHGRTPPGEAGYVVRVPVGTKALAQRKIVELESDWDGYDAYVVAHGERFEDVATTYGLSIAALRKLNDVGHESEIAGGTVLVVPRITAEQRAKNLAKAKAKLLSSGIDQKEGEPLIVPVLDKDAVVAGKKRVFYRVVIGDTAKGIAKALGTTTDQLAEWNGLDDAANLHPKMVLVAWVAPKFDADKRRVSLLDETQLVIVTRGSPEHLDLAEARTGRVRTEYVAEAKEKLSDIAKKFGMGSHDLARINRISYDSVLAKGEKCIVYQVADPKRSKRADEQWNKTPRARRGKVNGQRAQTTASAPSADEDDDAEDAADSDADAKPEVTKPEPKKSDAKKPDVKKAEPNKGDAKKGDPKADAKKVETGKAEPKTEVKQPDAKKADANKVEPKADVNKTSATKVEPKTTVKQADAKKADAKKPVPDKAEGGAEGAAPSGPVTKPTQVD